MTTIHGKLRSMPDDCIAKLKGSTYAVAPGSDFSIYDILFNKIFELYFHTMGGFIEVLALSTTLTGAFSSYWMELLTRTNLRTLNASNNNFEGVLPNRFGNLPNLTTLEMRNCKLKGIHQANLDAMMNLEVLDLCGNEFQSPPVKISDLRKLRSLNLCFQRNVAMFSLGDELPSLTALKELKLFNLPLTDFDKSRLPASLELLDVSYCQLSSLPPDIFSDMPELTRVVLTGNLLSTLNPHTFRSMPSGASIIASKNLFHHGQKLVLQNDVSVLDLSHNHLSSLCDIVNNGTVDIVDLSCNDIVNWTTSACHFNSDNLSSILHLNLSENSIPVIDSDMANSLNTLHSVDIGGNQFDCQDCSLLEFQHWLNNTKTDILLWNHSDPVRCVLPPRQRGQLLSQAQYNSTSCLEKPVNYRTIAGICVGIVSVIFVIVSCVMYLYRYEISYAKHLYNVKRKNESTVERDGCKYDVFVSFSSKDRDWVMNVLVPGLENPTEKYVLCLHDRDFRLGSYIMDNVVECIDKSRRTILVLSNNFINSQWCKWELQMAQHRVFENCADFLIMLELEKLERDTLPTHLRVLMSTRVYLEWPDPAGGINALRNFWARLIEVVGEPLAMSHRERVEEEVSSEASEASDYQHLLA